ncbi:hypothetical protein, partial [Sulfoacidibacillus ferrooxidans]|uniref:hypothetical protein n=1 Tax=Sulfoacidibacillus ferrooxidans TaxID=2005001 RepID=UPI001F512808
MVHHTSLVLRVIGLLIALSGLSFVLYQAFREAEWLREVKTATQPTHQKKPWVGRYILRIQEAKKWMGKEDEPMYRTILRVIALAMGLMVMLLLLRYSILIAFLIGIGGALLITDRYYVTKGNQAKERHLKVFLEEAVPVGIHVITASGELAPAFSRMASTVTYPPLKARLQRLADTWKLPQFATAEDAFLHFAHDMGLLELTIFALCTKEVRAYRVPLEELWMEMSELLGLEI